MIPKEVRSSLEGEIIADVDLGAGKREKVYSYNFTIPDDYRDSLMNLKTIVNVKYQGTLYKYEIT